MLRPIPLAAPVITATLLEYSYFIRKFFHNYNYADYIYKNWTKNHFLTVTVFLLLNSLNSNYN